MKRNYDGNVVFTFHVFFSETIEDLSWWAVVKFCKNDDKISSNTRYLIGFF